MLNTNDLANDQAELENAKLILQLDRKIENLIKDENNPEQIWETNLLGKSLSALVGDNISSKIVMMPQDAQRKMRKTLGRIINEGKGGVLCILL